jgi:hypothetical protein
MNSPLVIGLIWISCLASSAFGADGSAPGGRTDFRLKAQKKESVRWTLQEWLAQKERNQLMDLWLVTNSPSPYEFFVKGSYLSYTAKPEVAGLAGLESTQQSYQGAVGAYASIMGLEADYENNTQESYSDLAGSLNLRIMGNANQGTHLNLHYGMRTRQISNSGVDSRIVNQFAGADLNLYLSRHFGLQGLYNKYFSADEAVYGTVTGTRAEAGLFIDFEAFRVFGNWFSDRQENEKAGVKSSLERVGIQSGFKFFF